MERIKIRRGSPTLPAIIIALAVTALFVYWIARSAMGAGDARIAASADAAGAGDVRMEGMEISFLCDGRFSDCGEAQIAAAQCAEEGGAGLVLCDAEDYYVVRDVSGAQLAEDAVLLNRKCGGITLRISAAADQISAVAEAVDALHALAWETASMAEAMEAGSDSRGICALLNVYRTRALRAAQDLPPCAAGEMIAATVSAAAERIDCAIASPDAGKIRLIRAAACADWISLVEKLIALTAA